MEGVEGICRHLFYSVLLSSVVAKCTDCVTAVVGGGGAVNGYSPNFYFSAPRQIYLAQVLEPIG